MLKSFLIKWVDVRRGERATALGMALFFFLAMATFWAMKPMKRGLFISYHKEHKLELLGAQFSGAEAEQLAKVVNVCAALLLAMGLSYISRRLAPRYVVLLFCLLSVAAFPAYASVIGSPSMLTVWSFYVFGDMYNTLMLTLFWILMNDSVKVESAKRLYGIVGLGGVTGGMIGATLLRSSVMMYGREMILLLCIVPTIIIGAIGFFMARRKQLNQPQPDSPDSFVKSTNSSGERLDAPRGFGSDNSLFRGLRLLASSKYLLAISMLVAFYEIASSIVDFQLSAMVEQHVTNGLARDQYFGFLAQIQGFASIFVQLFLTSYIMRRFGVGCALLALPAAIFLGSISFLLLPTLSLATLMSVSDNSMNYSINQSAKEVLYVPMAAEEKYQAKAFIDMFVQRFAKVIAVGLNLSLVAFVSIEQVRWLSLASLLMLTIWIGVVRFAGHNFDRLAREQATRIIETDLTLSDTRAETHGATSRSLGRPAMASASHASC